MCEGVCEGRNVREGYVRVCVRGGMCVKEM